MMNFTEDEDAFTDDLQVLVKKIISCKLSFHFETNNN